MGTTHVPAHSPRWLGPAPAGEPREDTCPGRPRRARAAALPRVRARDARGPGRAGPRPDPAAAADDRQAGRHGRLHGADARLRPSRRAGRRRLRAEGDLHLAGQPGDRQGRAPGRGAAVRRGHRGAAGAGERVGGHRGPHRGRLRRGHRPARTGPRRQARPHARAIAAPRPLNGIRIAGRHPGPAREAADELAAELGLPVSTHEVADAVAGADLVVTATTSSRPVLQRAWLSAGTHVNAVGACVPGDREVDTATMAEAALFADSRESVRNEAGDYLLAEREAYHLPIRAELREVLIGAATGRAAEKEITLFESLALAAEDLAAASYLYEKAKRLGAGTAADF